eukprot:3221142-Alexandrium_andersonii.AAC.1
MSASLVGSEMCIRDSSWTAASRIADCKALCVFPGEAPPPPGQPKSRLQRCLLYTSDAADDM